MGGKKTHQEAERCSKNRQQRFDTNKICGEGFVKNGEERRQKTKCSRKSSKQEESFIMFERRRLKEMCLGGENNLTSATSGLCDLTPHAHTRRHAHTIRSPKSDLCRTSPIGQRSDMRKSHKVIS